MSGLLRDRRSTLALLLALAALLAVYLPTLQTIPNGAEHYFTADVGEVQIVLNTWGTLHSTGYPLYVVLGNLLVGLLRGVGVPPVAAPAAVSLLWGVAALAALYALAVHLTGRVAASAAAVLLLGLTRTVWVHHVVAEIYTFGLLILALLFLLALWRGEVRGRITWLALLGGVGVGHHRALALAAPALLYAAWPALTAQRRRLPRILTVGLTLGLLGLLLPYLYLPLRAWAGARWVYGQPGTWPGFWDQFIGAEAGRYIGLPESWEALRANLELINGVLVTDLTLPGLLAGIGGLLWALRDARLRRAAVALLLSAGAAYAFHVLFYVDVLSALILQVLLAVAFGWLFAVEGLLRLRAGGWRRHARRAWVTLAAALAITLLAGNWPFVNDLVHNRAGLETIELVAHTPPGATLMLAWGMRYFAAGMARDVDPALAQGRLQAVTLVDHRAGFWRIVAEGMLVTPAYTLYNQPPPWWEERIGGPVYLQAAAPYLVQIDMQPGRLDNPPDSFGPAAEAVRCGPAGVILEVTWYTPERPQEDLSVFVHALDADGALIAQSDQAAPVYGWRPLTGWEPGEAVRDVYPLAVDPARVWAIRYGLYRVTDEGFENVYIYNVPVDCRAP